MVMFSLYYDCFPNNRLKVLQYMALITVLQYITMYWIITPVSWYVLPDSYQYTAL